MKNKFAAALLAGASLLTMTACGSNASADTGADANADTGAAAGDTAKVAVVQLVDNDAFTEMIDSFENKLTELYGDGVAYDVKNAQGDMSTLNSIASELKTADYDLVVLIVSPRRRRRSSKREARGRFHLRDRSGGGGHHGPTWQSRIRTRPAPRTSFRSMRSSRSRAS